jgi:hypothetical protein
MGYVQDENGVWRFISEDNLLEESGIGQEVYNEIGPLENLITKKVTQPEWMGKPDWQKTGKVQFYQKKPLVEAREEGFTSLAEKEIVAKAGETKDYPNLNWWRKEDDYVEWLRNNEGWDPDSTPDWMGNKKYLDYIKFKAENPGGIASLSQGVGEALGSVIGGVSDLIKNVPIIGKVAKPIGSVFKFIGNMIDMPMNMIRGTISALGPGHPDEILNNVWQAMKHGLTAGTEGTYYSFSDAALRVMLDKAKNGMSDDEYQKYIDSDDYRKTKRFWQAGGLLADLVLDPMWLVGAGESKVMESFRGIKSLKTEIAQLVKSNYKMSNLNKLKDYWQAFNKGGDRFVNYLSKDSALMQDFGLSYDLLKKYKLTTNEVAKQNKLAEIVDTAISSYNSNLQKFDAYGSRVRLYKPFTKHEEILLETPLKLEPIKRYMSRWFGGEARQNLRHADRLVGFYEDAWKLYDKTYHPMLAKAKEHIDSIYTKMKEVNPAFTKEDANNIFFQMMESSMVDKKGQVFSRVVGDQPGFKILKSVEIADPDIIAGMEKMSKRDLAKMTGTELTDYVGDTIKITDGKMYIKELIRPFAKLNTKLYPELVKDMEEMVTGWHRMSQELLKTETALQRQLYNFLERSGLSNQSKHFLSIITDSRKSRRVWGVQNVNDIKSGELVHEFISYMPHKLTDQAKAFVDAVDKMKGEPISSNISQLFHQTERLQWVPTDFTNDVFLRKIFDKNHAGRWIAKIRKGQMTPELQDKLWHESMSRIREIIDNRYDKKFSSKMKELRGTNLSGNPYNFDDMGVVKYAGEDFKLQPLIQRMDAVTINNMSREGKIFKNFKDDIFRVDPEVMGERINATYKLKGSIEANIFGLNRGIEEGWLKNKHIYIENKLVEFEKPAEKYMGISDWVSGDGIFAGHWVPELFKDNMDALSKGILKWTEPPDIIRLDKYLQSKPFQLLKQFNQWWKVQVTMKHPAFHARNFFSNRVVMMGEGRSPHYVLFKDNITKDAIGIHLYQDLLEKRHLLSKAGKDTTKIESRIAELSKKTINLGDFGDVPIQVALDNMLKHGVSGNGLTYDIIGRSQKKAGLSEIVKNKEIIKKVLTDPQLEMPKWKTDYNLIFGSKDKWTQTGTKAASFIEGALGRNELFLHLIRNKGLSIEDAARRVNKVLVDYGALSKGEKILKDYLWPFYSWQSRMIGVMLEKAITQPIMFNKLTQLQSNMYKILELDKAFAPQYEKTGEGLPIIMGIDNWNKFFTGKPLAEIDTKYITAERFLPQAVVNLVDMNGFKDIINPINFAKRAVEGFLTYSIGNMTLFLKTPVEQLIDYSFYFKRPITRYADQTVKYCGITMSPKVQNVIRSFIGGMKEVDDVVGWFDKNAYTGKPYHTVDTTMFSWLLGGKAYDRDEIREIQYTLGDLRDQYRYNARDAKNKVFNDNEMKNHARKAVALKYAINILEWYKNYALEFRDKELYDKMTAMKVLK